MPEQILLGVGSNLGDREQNIFRAKELLNLKIVKESSLYETEPVGYRNQPWFLNVVWEVESDQAPREILRCCLETEDLLERKRIIDKGPRTMDLDILFYGKRTLNEPDLKIPHPAIAGRRFVLIPLAEIVPDFQHPVLQLTVRELLDRCQDQSKVSLYRPPS